MILRPDEISFNRNDCEYTRHLARQKFDQVREAWCEWGRWAAPHRIKWMLSQMDGQRVNQHIVDGSHVIALRSYVAGFMEGNTSSTRPWFRSGTNDPDLNKFPSAKEYLDALTRRTLTALSTSNFYNACGQFYYDYGVFNTGAYFVDETRKGLFFHALTPGSYYVLNNGYGEATTLVREFELSVKATVEMYGVKKNGMADWSNFSKWVKEAYEKSNYTLKVPLVHMVQQNNGFNPNLPVARANQQWIAHTYESGANTQYGQDQTAGINVMDANDSKKCLKVAASKRKPFIVGRSFSSNNFEYGEQGPTADALGVIRSLNKKAISKDQALEQMIRPAMQGPASLKKQYMTTASNSYVPLDPTAVQKGGLRPVFEINPAMPALVQDVSDLRQMVDKFYYADYLLYLSRNPKTRTATETNAIVQEQQLIIGPNLQSLNWTHNVPVVEFVMDYVLFEDPTMPPPPEELGGKSVRPEFISVFAQAQKAADLPAVERYMQMVENVGQIAPQIFDKVNLDKLADIYEDRLFLPPGLNNPQDMVDAKRQQAQAQAQQQQMMTEALPALAGAAKDVGLGFNNQGNQ